MAETATRLESLRLNRLETGRLALVLALSLALHLLVWGGYEAARKFDVWRWLPRLAWLEPAPKLPPTQTPEQPLEFVMVERPSTETPDKAKYYGAQNSRAANPDASRDLNVPKLNGTQTEVPKTETAPKPDFNKLQPAPKPANSEPTQPTPVVQPGDLTLGKPQPSQPEQTPPRPRTLQEARTQQHLPGMQMLQNGGVQHHAIVPSFDVKATLLGNYDSMIVAAIQQCWDDKLAKINYGGAETGKVVLQFHLNYDGRVSDMKILDSTVGQLMTMMCETAILDPAPYAAWPEDMRRLVGQNYREITFTFYYY